MQGGRSRKPFTDRKKTNSQSSVDAIAMANLKMSLTHSLTHPQGVTTRRCT